MKTGTSDSDQASVIAKMAREPLDTAKEIAAYERSFNRPVKLTAKQLGRSPPKQRRQYTRRS